jgi:hypothetical protein
MYETYINTLAVAFFIAKRKEVYAQSLTPKRTRRFNVYF